MRERNLYQRGGIWWLRATVAGVERRESLRVRDLKIARKLRDKKLDEFAQAAHHGQSKIGWKETVTAWAEHIAGQIAPSTAKRYAVSLLQCEPYLAKLDIKAMDGRALSDMVSARLKLGASPATIRRDLTAVSRVLEYAEAREWREGNPTLSKRRLLKERRDPIVLPTRADIDALLSACSMRFAMFVKAAILSGCRQNELVTAKWSSFARTAQTLEIIGKGNKRRTIKLSTEATAHLSAQPRTLGSDLIFCREGGLPFEQAASDFTHFRRKAEALAKKEGRPFRRFRFHDLRHLFAVEALRSGRMGIYELSKHLGHTSVKTTEIYLAFLTPEEAESAQKSASLRRSESQESLGDAQNA